MARALATTFPRFTPWPWSAYPDSVRQAHAHDTVASVRAVVGDFNGDGRLDVALDGMDVTVYPAGNRRSYPTIVAVLAGPDSATALHVTEGALRAGQDTLFRARGTWLERVPRGTFRARLRTDAIGVRTIDDRSVELLPYQVYLWARGRFYQWSDGE